MHQQTPHMPSTSISCTITNQNSTRIAHDKKSYPLIQDSPSPTHTSSSPSLTQSTSAPNSNSTNSPTWPTTPPSSGRGRASSRNRYPDLGRVPLHRRGTSKTYECLEDLLREAGYKETRVFTPEAERAEAEADERANGDHDAKAGGGNANQRGSMRGGVGAVVGFLAGLIPSAVSRSSSLHRVSNLNDEHTGPSGSESPRLEQTYSPPASPLSQKHTRKQKHEQKLLKSSTPSTPTTVSSIESLGPTPKPKPPSQSHSQSHSQTRHPPRHIHSHSHPATRPTHHQLTHQMIRNQLPHRPSQTPVHIQPHTSQFSLPLQQQQPTLPSTPSFHINPPTPIAQRQARPSRAGAYLRHMASTPNMSKRPNSTPTTPHIQGSAFPHSRTIGSTRGNGEGEEDPRQPPLPQTWLESVTRAVLFGGTGAHPGGPSAPFLHVEAPGINKPKLRLTKSSLSQTVSSKSKSKSRSGRALSDHTNKAQVNADMNGMGGGLAPPELFTRISRGRARRSEGEVSRTRVVCRSAPASRAGSRVRGAGERREESEGEYGFLMNEDGDGGRKEKRGRGREKGKKGRKVGEKDGVPSLARTKVEGEVWVRDQRGKAGMEGGSAKNDNRYLSGWGADPDSEADGDGEGQGQGGEQGSSSEEEEGELDLAKMLVPPKRQNSIRSLRRHLAGQVGGVGVSAGVAGVVPGVGPGKGMGIGGGGSVSLWGRDGERCLYLDGDGEALEHWGAGWVRKRGRGGSRMERDEDDGEVGLGFGFVGDVTEGRLGRNGSGSRSRTGVGGTGKRMGLPAAWAGLA